VWLVRAGYLSGKKVPKSERLGVELRKAPALQSTFVPVQSLAVYEMRVRELPEDGDHALFIGDVVRVDGSAQAKARPILFLGYRDFATLGEQWRFRR
jgi:flavin reductase (DIM6/NTAB) family NADH-FMN oxidoreductase RutF